MSSALSPVGMEDKIAAHNHTQHLENIDVSDIELAGAGLGTLQTSVNGRLILIPTPSADPNDPLNWSQAYKIYLCLLTSWLVFFCTFLSAGGSAELVNIALEMTGPPPDFSKTAYLFSTPSMFAGVGLFIWVPLANKFGKRPVYIISSIFTLLCVIWTAKATTYSTLLVARMGTGLFCGAGEALCPMTVTDLFFVHERGTFLGSYQIALSIGVSFGIVISGAIGAKTGNWRNIYWLATGMAAVTLVLVIFTLPETSYNRTSIDRNRVFADSAKDAAARDRAIAHGHDADAEVGSTEKGRTPDAAIPPRKTYLQTLAFSNGTFTHEPLWLMFIRPFGLFIFPAVLLCLLAFAVPVGFLVGVTTVFAQDLAQPPYLFGVLSSSLCFLGGGVGGLIAIPFAGWVGDWLTNRAAERNGGIREPEARLPAIWMHIILAPLGLCLYGATFEYNLNYMTAVFGIALLSFSLVCGPGQTLAYAVDVYKPIAGEAITCMMGYKSIVAFALSFGTNSWIAKEGHMKAFGEQAAILGFCLLLSVPMYFWGAAFRKAMFRWKFASWANWDADRDDLAVVMH